MQVTVSHTSEEESGNLPNSDCALGSGLAGNLSCAGTVFAEPKSLIASISVV